MFQLTQLIRYHCRVVCIHTRSTTVVSRDVCLDVAVVCGNCVTSVLCKTNNLIYLPERISDLRIISRCSTNRPNRQHYVLFDHINSQSIRQMSLRAPQACCICELLTSQTVLLLCILPVACLGPCSTRSCTGRRA